MDINKEKLKNRLNLKFQPLHHHRYPTKKTQNLHPRLKSEHNDPDQSIGPKNRSISHVKLPSLQKKNEVFYRQRKSLSKYQKLQKSERSQQSIISSNVLRRNQPQGQESYKGHSISYKNLPKVKIDSKEPINDTITFLIKNQILTIPKIVALLKKNQSEEFLYLKVVGMYEYQVCEEQHKGKLYVTVSKNGMIINGELVPLKTLIRQFQLYKKLKKVHYFKYYTQIKYLNKWKDGSIKARFRDNRKNISKLLFLSDTRLMNWKIKMNSLLVDSSKKGGWISNDWVDTYISEFVEKNKSSMMKELIEIIFSLLQHFQLPISASPDLMNRVLGNLTSLNLNFEKKMQIEKEISKFYKFARQLQMNFMTQTGFFIKSHLQELIKKIQYTCQAYDIDILQKLEQLDINDSKFVGNREQILTNNRAVFDIEFMLYLDPVAQSLNIKPSPLDIYYQNTNQIKAFISKVENIGLGLLNSPDLQFVLNVLFKGSVPSFFRDPDQTKLIFRKFVMSIPQYQPLIEQLRLSYDRLQQIYNRRITLLNRFLFLYFQFDKQPVNIDEPIYDEIKSLQDKIDQGYQFMQKLHDGEYFLFGYLDINNFKSQLTSVIKTYQLEFHRKIPILMHDSKNKVNDILSEHLDILLNLKDSPQSFIKVYQEIQVLEDKIASFSDTLEQLERIEELFQSLMAKKNSKLKINNQVTTQNLKRILGEIKKHVKQFNSKKDDNFIKYRKQLQKKQKIIVLEIEEKYGSANIQSQKKDDQIFEIVAVQPFEKQQIYRKQSLYSNARSSVDIDSFNSNHKFSCLEDQLNKAKVIKEKVKTNLTHLNSVQSEIEQINVLENFFTIKTTYIQSLPVHIYLYENLMETWTIYVNIFELQTNIYYKKIKDIQNSKQTVREFQLYLLKLQKMYKDNSSVHFEGLLRYLKEKVYEMLGNFQFISEINIEHLRAKDLQEINYIIQRGLEVKQEDKSQDSVQNEENKRKSISAKSKQQFSVLHRPIGIKCRQLTYQSVRQLNLKQFKIQISEVSFKARKEIQIDESIEKFQTWFKELKLEYEPLENFAYIPIFSENYKVRLEIEEYTIMLLNILNNKYSKETRKICTHLLNQISSLTNILQLAIGHQQKFLQLYPILTSKYAESQLSTEYKKFDSLLKKTMKSIKLLIKPTENLTSSLKSILTNHIKSFDQSQKALQKFLQKKRLKFQRFYFLQDDELLEVLVGISSEREIFRMFDGIRGWVYNEDGIKIGVEGFGGEKLILKGWVYKNIEPEIIFKSLEDSIKNNLNSLVRQAIYSYEYQLKQLKELYETRNIPWMCRYTIEMILFCKQIQLNCFLDQVDFQSIQNLLLEEIGKISTDITSNKDQKHEGSSHLNQNKIITNSNQITLLLFLLHYTEEIRNEGINSFFDFQWQSFLRYYYDKDSVRMRALGSQHVWGGEYQGLWSLMVNTSDLRRAHTCVLTNIKHGNGVLLQGPSGTGKTESLKQLGRCMGKYCVIFNCSQDVKVKTLEKILSGLCYTASWLCLDEINRLNIDIMSVIANQIISIKNAIVSKKQSFMFSNKQIKLFPGVGIFSTMNPIYLKRAKLTQNIKSYFRVMTVSIPDYEKILQIMLYSLQFSNPINLGKKIGNFFKNLSIQLGEFQQYDFGLRAMKSFVGTMSKYRQEGKQKKQIINQQQIIGKALFDTFGFRIDTADINRFQKIASDSFKVKISFENVHKINEKVRIIKNSKQTGIIVFGPRSCKTQLIKKFYMSLPKYELLEFNPNAVNIKYLMGQSVHGRWQHGVIQKMARQSLQNIQKDHIVFLDSIVKSQIIQSFNTLLDESRILSLVNGTRLKIKENFKIILQTPHLHLSSPATITRCNMIFLCENDVVRQQVIMAQLPKNLGLCHKKTEQIEEEHRIKIARKRLIKYFDKFSLCEIQDIGKLTNLILSEKIINYNGIWNENQILAVQKSIIFSIRILGYQEKIKELINKDNSFPIKKSPFDFILSFKKYLEGQFIEIAKTFQPVTLRDQLIIKTSQTKFCHWLNIRALSRPHSAIYWRGNRNSGKTTIVQLALSSLPQQSKHTKISVTPYLRSQNFLDSLDSKIFEKSKIEQSITLANTNRFVLFIEDMYLGQEQIIQQMRFIVEKQKIFDAATKQFVQLPVFTVFSDGRICQETKSEFNRVLKHFIRLEIPEIESFVMKTVYQEYIKGMISNTNTTIMFKSAVEIQIERFAGFLIEYEGLNTDYLKEIGKVEHKPGNFALIKVLNKINLLNQQNAKQTSDFISLMLHYLKIYQLRWKKHNSRLQSLILAYYKHYKQKYQKQFEKFLKPNYSNTDKYAYTRFIKTHYYAFHPEIQIKNTINTVLANTGQYYISEFLMDVILQFMTIVIENHSVLGYVLSGANAYGKRMIVKLAATLLTNAQAIEFKYPKQILGNTSKNKKQQKQHIQKFYFNLLKVSFQKKIISCIIINFDNAEHQDLINFINLAVSDNAATKLFAAEETDYMFSTISDFIDVVYEKSAKTYDEICDDYIRYASKRVKCIFINSKEQRIKELRKFPQIYKNSIIKHLDEYPLQSIHKTTTHILETSLFQKQTKQKANIIQNIASLFLKVYKVLRSHYHKNVSHGTHHFFYNHLTHFKLVQHFTTQYKNCNKRIKIEEDVVLRSREKVHEIDEILAKIQAESDKYDPIIREKKQKLQQIMPSLEHHKAEIKEMQGDLEVYKEEDSYLQQQLTSIQNQMKKKLQRSKSILNEALEYLSTVKRTDITDVKTNIKANPLVKLSLENIMILLEQEQSDENIKKVISDPNFLLKIKSVQSISNQQYQRLKSKIKENPEWKIENVAKIAYGLRYIVKFILTLVETAKIKEQTVSLETEVQKVTKNLDKIKQKEQQLQDRLATSIKQGNIAQREYQNIKNDLTRLEQTLFTNNAKYLNAQNISKILYGKMETWEHQLHYYQEIKKSTQMYNLMLALYLLVFPSISEEQQEQINFQIKKLATSSGISQPKYLNLRQDITKFYVDKQFTDKLTHQEVRQQKKIQFLYHMKNQPLLLDPDNQVQKWLEHIYNEDNSENRIVYTKQNFTGSFKSVEHAMKEGKILVIFIDHGINSFSSQIIDSLKIPEAGNARQLIEYNKNMFYLQSNFQLLFCCKSKNPMIAPSSYLHHPVINFEISRSSLRKRLILELLKSQNIEVHHERVSRQILMQKNEKSLREMEEKILGELINSKKNIVEDEHFIEVLNQSYTKTQFLNKIHDQQQQYLKIVEQSMKTFEEVCNEATTIYMNLKLVSKMNSLLVWNADIFVNYFIQAAQQSIMVPMINEDHSDDDFVQNKAFIDENGQNQDQEEEQFNNFHFTAARPSSAFSLMSAVTSKYAGDDLSQSRNSAQEVKQKQIHKTDKKYRSFEQLIGNNQSSLIDNSLKGKVDHLRYTKIIANLVDYLKHALTDQQRKVWGLILALSHENKQSIIILISIYQMNQKQQPPKKQKTLRQLIEQNLVTKNIKQYFSEIQPEAIQIHAVKLISDRQNILKGKYWEHLAFIDILIVALVVNPRSFAELTEEFMVNRGYATILQSSDISIRSILKNSDNIHPVLIIMGEDPLPRITQFFNKNRYKNAVVVSMGEGQEALAQAILEKQFKKQSIVIIHNLHISPQFFPFLTKTIEQFSYGNRQTHPNFRLILISENVSSLPPQLASSCQKYLIQQPTGVRNKMLSLYTKVISNQIKTKNEIQLNRTVYSLCLMHCLISQVHNYSPYGWNIHYNFTVQDFIHGVKSIKELNNRSKINEGNEKFFESNIQLEELSKFVSEGIDAKALVYSIGEINYLGKIADEMDKRKMLVYVSRHFNDSFLNNKPDTSQWGFKIPESQNQAYIQISKLPSKNPLLFDLHHDAQHREQTPHFYLESLGQIYSQYVSKKSETVTNATDNQDIKITRLQEVRPINHKFQYINQQIYEYNQRILKVKENQSSLTSSLYNTLLRQQKLLQSYNQQTRHFSLKSFASPRKIFSSLRMEMSVKLNVEFEAIQMMWAIGSLNPKEKSENIYSLGDIKLEGGNITNGIITDGYEQTGLTLYFWPIHKKKKKEPQEAINTKMKIKIPLYLKGERSGKISSFGENTNLLTMVTVESRQKQEFWILRGTAFIADNQ